MYNECCKHSLQETAEQVYPGLKELEQVIKMVKFTELMGTTLAEEMSISKSEVRELVREYGKFLYLMQFSKAPLTPSDEVDQVWHFHIANSRDYDLMGRALFSGFLHHNPT